MWHRDAEKISPWGTGMQRRILRGTGMQRGAARDVQGCTEGRSPGREQPRGQGWALRAGTAPGEGGDSHRGDAYVLFVGQE